MSRAVAHFTHIQVIFFKKNSQVLTEKSSSSAKMEVLSDRQSQSYLYSTLKTTTVDQRAMHLKKSSDKIEKRKSD